MKLLLDNTSSATNWSNVRQVNEIPDYITNDFAGSLVFETAQGVVAENTSLSINVSEYDEIVCNIFVVGKEGVGFTQKSDFHLEIIINGTGYFVPNYSILAPVSFPLDGITTITSIGFRHNFPTTENIVVSGIWAVTDEFPVDIYAGIKERLDTEISDLYTYGVRIGTLSGSTGDTSVTITGDNSYVQRYAVIAVNDSSNVDFYQLINGDERRYGIGGIYNTSLVRDYSNADVWIYFPVDFGFLEEEIAVPSIHIWGFAPQPILFDSKADERIYAYSGDSFYVKRVGQLVEYTLQLEVTARTYEVLNMLTRAVRIFLGKEIIWVNGRQCDFTYDTNSSYIEPVDADELLPRVVYNFRIRIREDIWQRITRASALPATLTTNLRSQVV